MTLVGLFASTEASLKREKTLKYSGVKYPVAPAGRERTLHFQGGCLWHLYEPDVPWSCARDFLPLLYILFAVLRVPSPLWGSSFL